jgi:hypothetical protein
VLLEFVLDTEYIQDASGELEDLFFIAQLFSPFVDVLESRLRF